jgi:hypothetical protein
MSCLLSGVLELLEGMRGRLVAAHATLIQKIFRGMGPRRTFSLCRAAACRVQTRLRSAFHRQAYLRLRRSVIIAQSVVRMRCARCYAQRLRKLSLLVLLQSFARMCVLRLKFVRVRKASRLVGRLMRTRLIRTRYLHRLMQSREDAKLSSQVQALQRRLEEEQRARAMLLDHQQQQQRLHQQQQETEEAVAATEAKELKQAAEVAKRAALVETELRAQIEALQSQLTAATQLQCQREAESTPVSPREEPGATLPDLIPVGWLEERRRTTAEKDELRKENERLQAEVERLRRQVQDLLNRPPGDASNPPSAVAPLTLRLRLQCSGMKVPVRSEPSIKANVLRYCSHGEEVTFAAAPVTGGFLQLAPPEQVHPSVIADEYSTTSMYLTYL